MACAATPLPTSANVNGTTDPAHDLPDGWNLMKWINEEVRE